MSFNNDDHLNVCQDIEAGIKLVYDEDPAMTDAICMFALDQGKIGIKQRFGYAENERVTTTPEAQALIAWFVMIGLKRINKVNDLTLKDYVARLEKIKKSVGHHTGVNRRSYYQVIRNYLP